MRRSLPEQLAVLGHASRASVRLVIERRAHVRGYITRLRSARCFDAPSHGAARSSAARARATAAARESISHSAAISSNGVVEPIGQHVHDLHAQRVRRQRLQQRLGVEQRAWRGLPADPAPCRSAPRSAGTATAASRRSTCSPKAVGAELAHVAVRIVLRRQEQEADGAVVGGVRQTGVERAARGAAAGRIAVEAEDDRIGLAQQLLHMNRRAGRAERGDRVRETPIAPARPRPYSLRRPARSPVRESPDAPRTARTARCPC